MFILRYKKVVLCILDSAKVECIFEDLKDKSRVTTIIHHNYEEMVILSTDGLKYNIYMAILHMIPVIQVLVYIQKSGLYWFWFT
jgi:hypothetical protein